MAYTDTWNAAFEASPADADVVAEGAERIRDTRLGIRERMAHDHYFAIAGTDADHGEHNFCTFREQISDPTTGADKGALYTKDNGGATDLYFRNDASTVIQLSAGGGYPSVPIGEIILFEKDTAVSGYTLKTDKDDMVAYVTKGSGAGGESGGSDKTGGTWTVGGITVDGHTHTGPSHTHTGPSHNHQWYNHTAAGSDDQTYNSGGSGVTLPVVAKDADDWKVRVTSVVEIFGLNDSYTDNDGTGNTGASGTGSTGAASSSSTTSDATWRPSGRNFTRQERA